MKPVRTLPIATPGLLHTPTGFIDAQWLYYAFSDSVCKPNMTRHNFLDDTRRLVTDLMDDAMADLPREDSWVFRDCYIKNDGHGMYMSAS